ncbi:MAG: RNA polymerase sigma factor [Rubellimicrobium sp.]|nr:RNA polymerase sigma factor [Rubellimicrobium sp.]
MPDAMTAAAAMPQSEDALVARAAGGDAAAFERLMRRYNQRLFRTARAILKNDAEAEDALQEGWLKAWRALPGWRGQARLSTWLVRIVANEALGRLRRTTAQVIPLEAAMVSTDRDTQDALSEAPGHGPEATLARAEVRRLMESRIDLLPEQFRAVFMLRAVEEMSVAEVAEALDIPEATVRSRFHRARALLREGLAGEMDLALGQAFAFDGARCDRIVARTLAAARDEGLCRDS